MAKKIDAAKVKYKVALETRRFSKFVEKFAKESGEAVDREVRRFALQLTGDIVLLHPVDTGYSRAAWFPSIEELGGKPPGGGDAKAVAEGKKMGRVEIKPLSVTLINAVKYVPFLEFGHSKQAPHGMVRVAMIRLRGVLPKYISEAYKSMWDGKAVFRARRA